MRRTTATVMTLALGLPSLAASADTGHPAPLRPAILIGGGLGVGPLGGIPAATGSGFAAGGVWRGPWLGALALEGWASAQKAVLGAADARFARLSLQALIGHSLGPWTFAAHGGVGALVTDRAGFGTDRAVVPVLGGRVALGPFATGLAWSPGARHCRASGGGIACHRGASGLEVRLEIALAIR